MTLPSLATNVVNQQYLHDNFDSSKSDLSLMIDPLKCLIHHHGHVVCFGSISVAGEGGPGKESVIHIVDKLKQVVNRFLQGHCQT